LPNGRNGLYRSRKVLRRQPAAGGTRGVDMVPAVGLHRAGNRHSRPIHENLFLQVVQKTAAVRFPVRARHGNPSRFRFGSAGVRRASEFGRHQGRDAHQLPLLRAGFSQ